ncbi:hypothetical protein F4778DRAFT_757188 [Xylariomycetidae sp. FL2044]|nr:hypothetical protein F4778DRAFT_757188 [Xylariomycetidae sp. FL2044]
MDSAGSSSAAASRDRSAISQPLRSPTSGGNDEEAAASKKASARKRTKTGCLTCRRRRIKCDEGTPTCNNCMKSKRHCDGYQKGFVFKDPLGAFAGAGAPYGSVQSRIPSPQALVREQQLSAQQNAATSQPLQIIAPKPPSLRPHHDAGPQFSHTYHSGMPAPGNYDARSMGPPRPPQREYTFFPPQTIHAFNSQSEESIRAINQFRGPDETSRITSPTEPPSTGIDLAKDKQCARVETAPETSGKPPEDWDYPVSGDDESMIDSDDELDLTRQFPRPGMHTLGVVVADSTRPRTFSTTDYMNLLATYDPSPSDSPLNDPQIASVFYHFINVTGPSISVFERHPFFPTPIRYNQPVPKSQQHIWSYVFPTMAFTHPGLLHAILALASLQIAKMQQVPPMASLKHYHLSLRRIARNVNRPARRSTPQNLAATLLLAFYEVWNSDHDKWCRHLLGASWIIKEIPYAAMTRTMMSYKAQQRQRRAQQFEGGVYGTFGHEDNSPLYRDWDQIDVPLLSNLTGKDLSYDDFGMLPADFSPYSRPKREVTAKDRDSYEQYTDLFWWYCKMDIYQGILGGGRLFLNYDKWTRCPPRAPLGRLDAICGAYDHLLLLLGRLVNFSSRDLSRKRELIKPGAGGLPPGMFVGMVPTAGKVDMPMGFSPPRGDSPDSGEEGSGEGGEGPPEADLDTRTAEALREWESIRQAFETLRHYFGPEFEPLGDDVYPPEATPFGPTLRYRTYSIAGVWLNYYMGMVVLYRSHPSMPPVAMMAAGMAAAQTAPYAMQLARIAAGFGENVGKAPVVSTLVAAALIETAFPLFVAGVQYREDPQRHWLVRHLHAVARLTGWQSARQIASGCESAWHKAAQMGRGPPYARPPDIVGPDDVPTSVWEGPRRVDLLYRGGGGGGGGDHEGERAAAAGSGDGRIVLAKAEKAFYAMGLLSIEQDLERLDLESGDRPS